MPVSSAVSNGVEVFGPTPVSLAERLLTADDVADLLGVPRSTVYELSRRSIDRLPHLKIGRHNRYVRSDVERWLETLRDDGGLLGRRR